MAHILVIDDDAAIRAVIRRVLEREGHTVSEADQGDRGIEIVRSEAVDLVITDLIMPGKEGIETIQELRGGDEDLAIIAISGGGKVGPDGPLTDAELFGANASLGKPFDIDRLRDLVARLLAD